MNLKTGSLNPAGRLNRWIASVLDGFFLGLVMLLSIFIFQIIIEGKISLEVLEDDKFLNNPWLIIINLLIMGFYKIWFLYKNEATPGKSWRKIKVVQNNGKRISLPRAIAREVSQLIYLIPLLGSIIYFISVLLFLFSKSRRALHDIIGGTMVVEQVT